jgi:spermidine synthase
MGAAFPAAVRAVVQEPRQAGAVVGGLAGANTLGTIPGSVVAAYALIPSFGVQGSLFAIAALNVAVAALAVGIARPRLRLPALAAGAALAGAIAGFGAFGVRHARILEGSGVFAESGPSRDVVRLEEDAHGTVSLSRVRDERGEWLSLAIDGVNVAGTSPPLLACQTLQGQLPLLLHPHPRRVLHVGFGSGGTAAAVATHPEVEELHVAEINPAVLEVSRQELPALNRGVLDDPRVRVHLADGRNYLLGTRRRFDCILSDSIHPRYRGNASLYTLEYFELCRARLAEGGLVSTWLPIYSLSADSLRSIVATMREVFPATSVWYLNSTVNEFVIVVGRTEGSPIDVARIEAALLVPSVAENLREVGVTSVPKLLDYFVAEGEELDVLVGDVALHHDDRPWVELESAAVMNRNASWRGNLARVVRARTSVVPHVRGAGDEFPRVMALFEEATAHALVGHLCLLEGDSACRTRSFRAAVALNPEDREPWEAFGPPPWVRQFVAGREVAP